MAAPLLRIENLSLGFRGQPLVVDRATLSLERGQIAALVGESGSGKTLLARSILGLFPPGCTARSGRIEFEGKDLLGFSPAGIRAIRGTRIGMIFQEPMVSLNPSLKVGFQICEAMATHSMLPAEAIRARAIALLTKVQIQSPEAALDKYPHEFSGGMRQRIMIAANLMLSPSLLIADEPTTALDCLVQKDVLDLLAELAASEGCAVLLISHDLALVARYASEVAVMRAGEIVEQGVVASVFGSPQHDYTKRLLASLPHGAVVDAQVSPRPPLVRVRDVSIDYPIRKRWPFEKQRWKRAAYNVSLDLHEGETLAIVGESGSGKTSLGRAIMQLNRIAGGHISIGDQQITPISQPGFAATRDFAQMIFQDPYSSLSPRKTIGEIVGEPLRSLSYNVREAKVAAMLEDVGLEARIAGRYPNQLSGGQRQRVSIARAIILNPRLIVADEPVSALDVTIQAQILDLLQRLKSKNDFTCLFISHDLGVVEQIADRIVVMYRGRIVEWGHTRDIYSAAAHSYTRRLLSALPRLAQRRAGGFELENRGFSIDKADCADGAGPRSDAYREISPGHFAAAEP